jgi:hypothetical protein
VGEVTVIDKKPGRAEALSAQLREVGARAQAIEGAVEEVVADLDPQVPTVLAVDEVAPMAQVAGLADRVVFAQGVGRGPGSATEPAPALGINVLAVPERPAERRQVVELLRAMAAFTPPQSSAVLREDGLTAMALQRARANTSEHTAQGLMELERARERESLASLFWARTHYPLTIANGEGRRHARHLAVELGDGKPGPVAVALLQSDGAVDIYALDWSRGRHHMALWVPFQRLLPPPASPTRVVVDMAPTPSSSSGSEPAAMPEHTSPRTETPGQFVAAYASPAAFTD